MSGTRPGESKFSCPACGEHVAFPKELAGQEAPCPHCHQTILLPTSKPKKAWFVASFFIFTTVCLASILVIEHLPKHGTAAQVAPDKNSSPSPGLSQKDPLATSQLMSVIQYGGTAETVKQLLAKGADVNAQENQGWHPLQLAAKRGDLEIVRLLLDNGAEVNATNVLGVSALGSAAFRGYMDIVNLLVEKGANVNAKENFNTTVLATAAEAGRTNLVRFLLDKGADVNAEDIMGKSALDEANDKGFTGISQMLVQAGATKSSYAKRSDDMNKALEAMKKSDKELDKAFDNMDKALARFTNGPKRVK